MPVTLDETSPITPSRCAGPELWVPHSVLSPGPAGSGEPAPPGDCTAIAIIGGNHHGHSIGNYHQATYHSCWVRERWRMVVLPTLNSAAIWL